MPVVVARPEAPSRELPLACREGLPGRGMCPLPLELSSAAGVCPPPGCRGVHYAGLEAGRELLRRHNPHSTSFCVYYLHPSAAAAAAEPASTRQQVLVH
jgi:hypothetical protein